MKVVINRCFGGFSLSYKAVMRYAEIKGIHIYARLDETTKKIYGDKAVIGNDDKCHHYNISLDHSNETYWSDRDIDRSDPALIQVVGEMGGEKAGGRCADLGIIEIPDGVEWTIEEYGGNEWVAEKHRVWK